MVLVYTLLTFGAREYFVVGFWPACIVRCLVAYLIYPKDARVVMF